MRVARNIVEFTVDNIAFRAVFSHIHCKEHLTEQVTLPVYDEIAIGGGVLGSQVTEKIWVRDDFDGKVIEPLIEMVPTQTPDGIRTFERKLRHVTTCELQTADDAGGWTKAGEGHSRCSVKDRYDWRRGVKDSLVAAIKDAGIEKNGPILHAYYEEMRKRPVVAK